MLTFPLFSPPFFVRYKKQYTAICSTQTFIACIKHIMVLLYSLLLFASICIFLFQTFFLYFFSLYVKIST
nr:MAG TPA: hypothetical protein [Caudoviricetes sp.]